MSEWKETEIGLIPKDWSAVKFGTILEIPLKNGLNKPSRVRGNGYKMVNMNEIFAYDIIRNVPMEFVPLTEQEKKTSLLKKNDLLFARQSLVLEGAGKCSIFIDESKDVCFEGHLIRARLDNTISNPLFYYYFFSSNYGKRFVKTIKEQAVVAGIRGSDLKELVIPCPPKNQQDIVANILSCLDCKIENLRKQNETLEEIARSIFKHWFIDFEFPNADGKPYKSSGGVMVRSELGDIPEGWHVGKLGDVITVNPRESVKKGENIKFVDMRSLSTSSMEITDYIYKESASGSKFRNEDTLLARITPCLENGKTAFVSILDTDEVAVGSTEFLVLRAKNNCCPEYVYALARNPYFRDFAIKNMTGSSGRQRIPTDIVLNYKLSIPSHQVIRNYQETCHSLFLKTGSNQKQIQTLTKTRDILLPKLMSGQLRVEE